MNTSQQVEGIEEQSSVYKVAARKWIARSPTLTVMEFTLAPQQDVPFHYHSDCYDIFYCIEGSMIVEQADVATGQRQADLVLNLGDSARVDAGTAHRPFNPGPGQCRFVIIQGFGHKDFLLFKPAAQPAQPQIKPEI